MRILVTGGAGFIGGHVRAALSAAGHRVVAVDALHPAAHRPPDTPDGGPASRSNPSLLGSFRGGGPGHTGTHAPVSTTVSDTDTDTDTEPETVLRTGDVRDADVLRDLLPEADAVVHLAAMVGMGLDLADLPEYVGCNDLGTAVLLAEMARAGVGRLILASSMVVYGEGAYRCPGHGPVRPDPRTQADLAAGRYEPGCPRCGSPLSWQLVDEDTPVDPRSGYAATKVAQEHLASVWARQGGGTVTALRYHNVYGPGMPRDTPYSGVAAIFRSALAAGRAPRVFEDGGQYRDFVHVHDVARATVAALGAGTGTGFRAYNIASGRPITIGAVAEVLSAACGGPPPVVTGGFRPGDVRHVVASPTRAETELGFRATVDPRAGLAEFAHAPLRG